MEIMDDGLGCSGVQDTTELTDIKMHIKFKFKLLNAYTLSKPIQILRIPLFLDLIVGMKYPIYDFENYI